MTSQYYEVILWVVASSRLLAKFLDLASSAGQPVPATIKEG
jgi:hypothetical protein